MTPRLHPWSLLTAVLAAIAVMACSSSAPMSAQEVVESYFEAWNSRDVEAIMSHGADDAELEIDP